MADTLNEDNTDKQLLQCLLQKVMLFRLTRNLDAELSDRRISHRAVSEGTGRKSNWFNRTFNKVEDLHSSSLIKLLANINKLSSTTERYESVDMGKVFNESLLQIASVSIDLGNNSISHLIEHDSDFCEFFNGLQFYVDSLKRLNNVVSQEELDAYERIKSQITTN
jgi:hypothetical protein